MGLDKEDIKQLIQILQKGLVSDDSDQDQEPPPTTKTTKKNNTNRNSKIKNKKETITNFEENKFLSMGVHNLHKEDVVIDKALRKNPPTPRSRTFKKLEVRCRLCGKSESINPSLLYEAPDRYKCNKCCSSPG
jgi:hypothetical protein